MKSPFFVQLFVKIVLIDKYTEIKIFGYVVWLFLNAFTLFWTIIIVSNGYDFLYVSNTNFGYT